MSLRIVSVASMLDQTLSLVCGPDAASLPSFAGDPLSSLHP